MLAVDHSTGGAIIGGTLKHAGFAGCIRYACEGRGDDLHHGVNLTSAEVEDLKVNGIPIGIVCEHEADWLLRPGVANRVSASRDITRALTLPDGVIYLAADFDATDGGFTAPGSPGDKNMQTILASLNQAADVIGEENVGFYGSYYAIHWLAQHTRWLKWYWQTEAWSHGQMHSLACLYQRAQSENIAGVDCDIDVVCKPEWGQRVVVPPTPTAQHAKGTFEAKLTYNHDAQSVAITPLAGHVIDWGNVDEWIELQLGLHVGPHNPGQWRGKVIGSSPH